MKATTNIILAFPFAPKSKEEIHNSISMILRKRKKIEILLVRREKDVKFAIATLAVVFETLTK